MAEAPGMGAEKLTRREQVVVSVLLLVARFFATDEELRAEIKKLATHISVWT